MHDGAFASSISYRGRARTRSLSIDHLRAECEDTSGNATPVAYSFLSYPTLFPSAHRRRFAPLEIIWLEGRSLAPTGLLDQTETDMTEMKTERWSMKWHVGKINIPIIGGIGATATTSVSNVWIVFDMTAEATRSQWDLFQSRYSYSVLLYWHWRWRYLWILCLEHDSPIKSPILFGVAGILRKNLASNKPRTKVCKCVSVCGPCLFDTFTQFNL